MSATIFMPPPFEEKFGVRSITFESYASIQLKFGMLIYNIKLMKGKALRKHSLHEKTAASVLLKLFISGNE